MGEFAAAWTGHFERALFNLHTAGATYLSATDRLAESGSLQWRPMAVAAQSKVWAWSRSLPRIVCSNPTGGMDVYMLWVVCCQVEVSAMDWSLIQGSPTECGVSEWQWGLELGGPGLLGTVVPWKRKGRSVRRLASLSQLESCVSIVWRTASCCNHMWNLFMSSDLYPKGLVVWQRDLWDGLRFFCSFLFLFIHERKVKSV